MAFLRKEHKENYTCISNDVFKSDLSLKARGMLCTMLSLPDDWEFSENGLQAILKDGQTSVRSAIKELESAGFLSRTRERDENGRMGKCVWIVCDYPRFENPSLDTPSFETSNLGNGPQLSTKEPSTDKSNTDESSTNKKKERKRAGYDEIIDSYTENDELRSSLMEFVKMRKMMKKPLTNKGLSLLLTSKKGLDGLASNDAEKIDIVQQSIMRGWLGFFPLKDMEAKRNTVSRETTSGLNKKIDADYYYQSTGDEELDKVLCLGKYAPKDRANKLG